MVGNLMKYPHIFKKHFLSSFIELSNDKVINVRIVLARVIKKYFKKEGSN